MIDGYRFHLTCPCCASLLTPQAEGVTTGAQTRAVAKCPECSATVLIEVLVHVTNKKHLATPAKRAQLERARQKASA